MIEVTCKYCKSKNEIDETEYKPGSHITAFCRRCGQDIEVDIPGTPEEETPEQEISTMQEGFNVSSRDIAEAEVVGEASNSHDTEMEKARLMLEAERIRLEHRRLDHEEKIMSQQNQAALPDYNEDHPVGGKSKVTAGILALFLGGFGVHKFYLGKTGMGVLYLVFCWTYIPSVIGLVEAIIYFSKSDREFNRLYN